MADIPIATGSGSLTITPTGVTILNALPMYVAVSLPHLTASASSVVGPRYAAAITLPMLTVSAATQDLRLPMLTAAASLLPGNVTSGVQGAKSLPAITSAGEVLAGSVYAGAAVLPAISLSASSGTTADIVLPKLGASGSILSGARATADIALPRIAASGSAYADGLLSAAANLPALVIAAQIDAGRAMAASITLKKLALAASGYSGSVVSGTIVLPMFTMDGTAHGDYIGQATLELPMLQLVATLPAQSGIAAAVTVFAMNAKTGALTNYDNFSFNSMTRFNGVDLMANSSGIFAISGNLDEGAIINAYARMGVTDFGTNQHKRVEDAYIGYRADGEMRLKVIVDEHHEYEYQVYPRNYSDIHGNRLKMGKGIRGTYWQTEIGNVDGAGFEIDSLQLTAQKLSRKV